MCLDVWEKILGEKIENEFIEKFNVLDEKYIKNIIVFICILERVIRQEFKATKHSLNMLV